MLNENFYLPELGISKDGFPIFQSDHVYTEDGDIHIANKEDYVSELYVNIPNTNYGWILEKNGNITKIRKNPLTSVLIASGVGFILSVFRKR